MFQRIFALLLVISLSTGIANATDISQPEIDPPYNDPYLSLQWALSQIDAELAWQSTTENHSVVVAVLDTGVDNTHPDLCNRILSDHGYDFVNDDTDPTDDNGHGTHIAGIIAAEANNDIGIAGVAGALDVSILPIKVLDSDGTGNPLHIAAGIIYAVEMGADIINLSLGGDTVSTDILQAITVAQDNDILIVVPSGNNGTSCTQQSLANLDGTLTVAATTEAGTLATFSNYGDCVDVYAPGEAILSTYPGEYPYAYQEGTSVAASIVTGVAAVLLTQNPDLTVTQLTNLLSNNELTATSATRLRMPFLKYTTTCPITYQTQQPLFTSPINLSIQSFTLCPTVNLCEALTAMYMGSAN